MSTHNVNIIKVEGCEPHPDPETTNLGIVRIGGFVVVVNKTQWQFPALCAYIEPDSLVKVNRPEFSFLKVRAGDKEQYRVRVMKLRGVYSQGLLIPAPEGFSEGDDVMEFLEVEHYEPPETLSSGDSVKAPRIKHTVAESGDQEVFAPIYDVENINKFMHMFIDGEEIVAHCKIHGANLRATCVNGELFVGSRNLWKKDTPNNSFWTGIRNSPTIIDFLKANEGVVVYGELYGSVQNLKYGCPNTCKVALFDILKDNEWLSYDESQKFVKEYDLPWAPLVYRGPFDLAKLRALAEEDSSMPEAPKGHIREGLVIKPIVERKDRKFNRVQLKIISNRYLDKT